MSESASRESGTSILSNDVLESAARRLREAAARGVPCPPVRHAVEGATIEDAYAIQRRNIDLAVAAGARIAGWKVGLTSPAVQQQLGVDQPDFGVLLATTAYGDNQPIPIGQVLQPRAEAEIAFMLKSELPQPDVTVADVLRATAFVAPAIEIVGSRIVDWDITIIDTVADNASSGVYVVGGKPTCLTDIDLHDVAMVLQRDDGVVAEGSGAECLGHPVNAVVWLANTLARLGTPLQAGQVVLSGALGPMLAVERPGSFEAHIGALGSVRARFT